MGRTIGGGARTGKSGSRLLDRPEPTGNRAAPLFLYRLILSLVLPAIILRGLLREPGSVRARLRPPDAAGRLWVHAASLGELNAVWPILDRKSVV